MKKILKRSLCVLSILILSCAVAQDSDSPLLFDNSGGVIYSFEEDNSSLINFSQMKKSEKIENALENEKENQQKKPPKIKVDRRELNHQRALDYSSKQVNSLPLF